MGMTWYYVTYFQGACTAIEIDSSSFYCYGGGWVTDDLSTNKFIYL
jgi:hypothetical protein